MAIIKTKVENANTENKKPRAWSVVLKHVPVKLFVRDGYALVGIDDNKAEQLNDAPVDIELRNGVALFTTSKYCRYEITGEEVDESDCAGKGWANIKLRHADYDYHYKGKRGHTSKIELLGVNFLTFEAFEASGLSDDLSDAGYDGDEIDEDLPF